MAWMIDGDVLTERLRGWLESPHGENVCNSGYDDAIWRVLDVIDHMPTLTQPSEPLTEEQLKKMVGEPVWVESARRKEWVLLWGYHGPEVCGRAFIFTRRTAQKEQFPFSELGVTWWPYRRPPEGEGKD